MHFNELYTDFKRLLCFNFQPVSKFKLIMLKIKMVASEP